MNVDSVYRDKDDDIIVLVVDHLEIYRIDDTDYLKLIELNFKPNKITGNDCYSSSICLNVSNNKKEIRIFKDLKNYTCKPVLKAYQIPLKYTNIYYYANSFPVPFSHLRLCYNLIKKLEPIKVSRVGLDVPFQIGKNKYVKRKDSNSRTHILEMKTCNFVKLDSNILIDKIIY